MMENAERTPRTPRRYRIRLFWPLLLIGVGLIFLLQNLGVLQGDAWTLLVRLWPLVFIVGGLDGFLDGEGLAGSALSVAAGSVFLAANFGLLHVDIFEVAFRMWPLLLVAAGADLILGRRSLLLGLVGMVVVLALFVGGLLYIGVGPATGMALSGERISQGIEGATDAHVVLEPGVGELRLKAGSAGDELVAGVVSNPQDNSVVANFSHNGDTAVYRLRQSSDMRFTFPGDDLVWDLALNPSLPLNLEVDMGVGDGQLDLTGLALQKLQVNMGVGMVRLTLPAEGSYDVSVSSGVGNLIINVPQGLGVRILERDMNLSNLNLPDGYEKRNGAYYSAGYDSAEHQVDLSLGMGIGSVQLREQ